MKLNFLIAGTQKAGTTALDHYMRQHPDICMAKKKEVHFFDNEKIFAKKIDYSFYHASFLPDSGEKILGESTPIYMYWENSPERVFQYNPDMKFIIVLRNPIQRAFSHWNMERSRGAENLTFWDAINQEKERCMQESLSQHRVYSYIDRGYYSKQLKLLWSFFPKKNFLLIKYEDLRCSPKNAIQDICSFLGVPDMPECEMQNIFSIPYELKITEREYSFLFDKFKDEICLLEKMLKWDLDKWKKGYE